MLPFWFNSAKIMLLRWVMYSSPNFSRYFLKIGVIVLFLQTVGQGGQMIFRSSAIESYLFLGLGISDSITSIIDTTVGCLLVLVTGINIWRPNRLICIAVGLFFVLESIADTYMGGSFSAKYALASHAARFGLAFGVAFLAEANSFKSNRNFAVNVIQFSICLTFVAHGLEAINHHPQFVDFIIGTTHKVTSLRISEPHATAFLLVVGMIDVLVAILVVSKINDKIALIYMLCWGLLTASIRIIYWAEMGFFPFWLRSSHWGIPLLLLGFKLDQRPNTTSC